MNQYRTGGFTLIELLVVVLIIGILAAVSVPQYQRAVYKSRMDTLQHRTLAIKAALERYFMENGSYTTNLNELDVTYEQNKGGVCWADLGSPEVIRCRPEGDYYDILFQYFLDNNSNPSFKRKSTCFSYHNSTLAKDYCKSSGMTYWSNMAP